MTIVEPTTPWVVGPGTDVDWTHVGGKAAALMVLHREGVPVPPFAVVTTDAFRRAHEPDATLVGLEEDIACAASQLAGPDGRLAVRSSATAEDQAGASYAGQFRSVLGVAPHEVMQAVRDVWASLWSPAATRYRARQIDTDGSGTHNEPAMAVLLMRQVAARRAGVAFTRDPTGHPDQVRVEAVEGLAHRLVAGEQTPGVTLAPRGGPPAADPVIAEVVRWALRCEEVLGTPQDVEWVWDGHTVTVVQSRPITAIGAAEPGVATHALAEVLPPPLPPLVWDTAALAIDHAMTALFHHLGALPDDLVGPYGIVTRVGDGAGLRLDPIAQAARRLPSTTPERLEDQLVGRLSDRDSTSAPSTSVGRRVVHDLRVARCRARSTADTGIVLQAVDHITSSWGDAETRVTSPDQLWQARQRHLDLLMRVAETEVAVAALAAASFDGLVRFLTPYVGSDATSLAVRLSRHGVASSALARWMDVAHRVRRHPLGREALGDQSWPAVRSRWCEAGHDGVTLLDDVERSVRLAGSRAVPGGVTWSEQPQQAWDAIRAASSAQAHRHPPVHDDAYALPLELTSTARWRRRRMLTGMIVDSQSILARRHIAEVRRLLQHREALKGAMSTVGGEVRRIHRLLDACLHECGLMAEGDDIDDRTAWQVAALVAGDPSGMATPDRVLTGWSASSGCYEGVARVVTSPEDPFDVGEILVARTTDPSWSPLFMVAGALVVEQGGPLSHAAIIARELGIPAVVNVAKLTATVANGMRVRVDGGAGRVEIVDGGDGDAPRRS